MVNWHRILLAALSGLLLALLFPRFNLFFFAWFALIPLLIVLRFTSRLLPAAGYGLVTGLVFFGLFFAWAGLFGKLAWSALTVYMAFYMAVFAAGTSFLLRKFDSWPCLFLIPAWMVSVELVRSIGWWGFSWGSLGYSQQSNLDISCLARIGGFFALSYLIVLVNMIAVEVLFSYRSLLKGVKIHPIPQEATPPLAGWSGVRQSLPKLILVLMSALVLSYGLLLICRFSSPLSSEKDTATIKIAAIQGNIPQSIKFADESAESIKQTYLQMTAEAVKANASLIIWPETSYPGYLQDDQSFTKELQDICDQHGVQLIVGTHYFAEASERYFNSAFFFRPRQKPVRYDKVNIVPFGEYVPFRPLFRWVKALEPIQTDLSAASQIELLPSKLGKIGVGICFESSNPWLAGKMISQGAGLLVFITNDAWFEQTAAPAQHLQTTVMRSIENNIYTVQAANTGISAVIAPDGSIQGKTRLDERKILYGWVKKQDQPSFYSRFGFLFPYLCLFSVLLALAVKRR